MIDGHISSVVRRSAVVCLAVGCLALVEPAVLCSGVGERFFAYLNVLGNTSTKVFLLDRLAHVTHRSQFRNGAGILQLFHVRSTCEVLPVRSSRRGPDMCLVHTSDRLALLPTFARHRVPLAIQLSDTYCVAVRAANEFAIVLA